MSRYLPSLIILAGFAGCASHTTQAVVAPSLAATGGTILSIRAVSLHAPGEAWRTALLASAGADDNGQDKSVEFIVRADDGATLSIVQANEPGFRTGDRVVILRDAQTHLARPR